MLNVGFINDLLFRNRSCVTEIEAVVPKLKLCFRNKSCVTEKIRQPWTDHLRSGVKKKNGVIYTSQL